jgi:hypothetical protein
MNRSEKIPGKRDEDELPQKYIAFPQKKTVIRNTKERF